MSIQDLSTDRSNLQDKLREAIKLSHESWQNLFGEIYRNPDVPQNVKELANTFINNDRERVDICDELIAISERITSLKVAVIEAEYQQKKESLEQEAEGLQQKIRDLAISIED